MKVKRNRKSIIAQIISESSVHTHEELAAALSLKGIDATQATLSRDIRELGAVKSADGCYRLPSARISSNVGLLLSVECSGQFCVIRTKPGFASAFATLVDAASLNGVMGSLAGDDTVLVILRQGTDEGVIVDSLKKLI